MTRNAGDVLLLHGAGGGGWEWNVWARVLAADGWRTHAPDLQPVADGLVATRLGDYFAQADAWLASLPRPRVVIGASLGGLLAWHVAARAETRVIDALVLVNPLPPAPWHLGLPAAKPRPEVIPWREHADLAGTRAALPDAHGADAWFAFRHWRDEAGAVLDAARSGVALARPSCPVLVLGARHDADVPERVSRELAQAIDADFFCVENSSHVGVLFGREAAIAARDVVTWLNVKIA
jgi:pimeloyl-ACP methyl ester carboxylesterase